MLGSVHIRQLLALLRTVFFSFESCMFLPTTLPLSCAFPCLRPAIGTSAHIDQALCGKPSMTSHFIPMNLGSWLHHPSSRDGETGVLRTRANCPRSSEQLSVQVCSQSLQALPLSCILCILGSWPHSLYGGLPVNSPFSDKLLSQNLDSEIPHTQKKALKISLCSNSLFIG